MLNFTISHDKLSLLLNDRPCYPLDSPRYKSLILGRPSPSPTSFWAFQVQANISAHYLDLLYPPGHDRYGRPYGTSMGGYVLAYEHVLFPAHDPNDILLLFNLIGVRDGYVDARVDMDFSAANRMEETVQMVLTMDKVTGALNVTALELVPRLDSKGPVYVFGDEFNRTLDLIASEPNRTTFIPRDWDSCGRKDDSIRQCFCNIGYWWSDNGLLIEIIVGSVIGGISVLASLLYLAWRLRQFYIQSAEYAESLRRNEDESDRLISTRDLQDDGQDYTQDKFQVPSEGDTVVVVDGEPILGGADFLPEPAVGLGTSKPLPQIPLELDPTPERQRPSHDSSEFGTIEGDSGREDSEFGTFVHNIGD